MPMRPRIFECQLLGAMYASFATGVTRPCASPREFELEGEEAIIHKEGDRLIVEPIRKGRLLALLASLDPLTEPFPDIDDDLPPLDDGRHE